MTNAVRVSDWIASTPSVSRSTFYELIKICGIEPVKSREPGSRSSQSWLTVEQQEHLNFWAQTMSQGATLNMIREKIALRDGTVPQPLSETESETSSIVVQDSETPEEDKGSAIELAPPAGLSEAIQNIRTCVVQDGVLDPLEQARRINEAIELEAELTDLQLALLLGEDLETVTGWKNPRQWSKKIRLCPATVHGQRRWTLERTTSKTTSTESVDDVRRTGSESEDSVRAVGRRPSKKMVGFDVTAAVINVTPIDCTGSDLMAQNTIRG